MSRRIVVGVVVMFFTAATRASQPGHPLDCSDWVFMEPGHTCLPYTPLATTPSIDILNKGSGRVADNTGRLYIARQVGYGTGNAGIQIVRSDGQNEQIVAFLPGRTYGTGNQTTWDVAYLTTSETIEFDAVNGRLLVPHKVECGGAQCPASYPPGVEWSIDMIIGFTPLFEILQTYTPTADALQFRVPAHPEGLRSADHFDTYWGHVSELPDFTQAQPMQCHYPASPPNVGDYMTVADTSPQPVSGEANYILTAVTNGTQRRNGRKLIAGVMSGRNPALLPGCP